MRILFPPDGVCTLQLLSSPDSQSPSVLCPKGEPTVCCDYSRCIAVEEVFGHVVVEDDKSASQKSRDQDGDVAMSGIKRLYY